MSPEYLAGVIDSDGALSIGIRQKDRKNPHFEIMVQLSWSQTSRSKAVMDHLVNTYGGSYFNGVPSNQRYANGRPIYKYCAVGAAAQKIVEDILPHLQLKTRQARNLLRLRKIKAAYTGVRPRPEKVSKVLYRLERLNKTFNTKNGVNKCTF